MLELGLNFCPSQKDFDEDRFTTDIFQFVRRHKLREYFSEHGEHTDTTLNREHEERTQDTDREQHNWRIKNPNWYPDAVRVGRSEALREFLDKFIHNIRSSINSPRHKSWNNTSPEQRRALRSLAADTSITIKPADKGGSIVVMDTTSYQQACEDTLNDTTFYRKVDTDPNPEYRSSLDKIVDEIFENKFINKVEQTILKEESRTPLFMVYPKYTKCLKIFHPFGLFVVASSHVLPRHQNG